MLAVFNREPGAEFVEPLLPKCQIGSVNLAEIATKLNEYGYSDDEIVLTIDEAGVEIIPFEQAQAIRTGTLRSATRSLGLSLGDRACLALAELTRTIALTADRAWLELELGIEVQSIR